MRFLNPISLFDFFWSKRQLIKQFSKREVSSKYKGSFLGILWSIITPLIMITVYTFVFSVVFKGRWGIEESTNKFEFAIIMFCGLTVYNIFSETLNRAPLLISSNVNYVKKVVFPLEILPVSVLISTLVHAFVSFLILLASINIFMHISTWTTILGIVILIPLIFLSLGLSFIISALGVYIRDLSYTISLITTVLFYVTPIFYPITAVPDFLQPFMYLNPLTSVVENFRNVVIWGTQPNWTSFFVILILSYLVLVAGVLIFKKVQRGFSDVL